jgi:hypothetical protein
MMWKYAAAKGVSGTPFAFVNGIKLEGFPGSAAEWTTILTDTYNSQVRSHTFSYNQQEIRRPEEFLN